MDELEAHLVGQTTQRLSFWHEVRSSVALEHLPPGGVVADIGAGAGHLGAQVRRDRADATYRFLEPIESLSAQLTQRFGDDARLDAIGDVTSADLVTLLDVIEHVEDDRGLLSEVVSAMRAGTVLVITVPALPWLWSPWDEQLGHHRRYTKASLRAAVHGLAVDVERVDYLFPELIPPAVLRRLARGRVGRHRAHQITEYPELPRWVDRSLWAIGTATARLRRLSPAGTSVVLTGRRR
jgi:hypothetical protein